jgi:hypothetical protein
MKENVLEGIPLPQKMKQTSQLADFVIVHF